MPTPFTHLRAHTEYSIVESTLRVSDLIARAKADGQPSVAMTDVDGLFGAIQFYEEARAAGIKPIVGVDIQVHLTPDPAPNDADGNPVSPNPNDQGPRRVALIARDYQGYRKLMRLVSRAYTENQVDGRPVLPEQWLRDENPEGLLCLSGTDAGHIGAPALAGNFDQALSNAQRLQSIFASNFAVEVQRRGAATDAVFVQAASEIASQIGAPLVATHPMQFAEQKDFVAHELKVCDARGEKLPAIARVREFTPYQHFQTGAEMSALFADMPDAVANASAIAQGCSLDIPLGRPVLPDFTPDTGETLTVFLDRVTREGLEKRLSKLFDQQTTRDAKRPEYVKRLDHELATIRKMGFEGYFAIVYDFINFANEAKIPVGPGRGSGAGSLVAYSLGVTDVDPIKYGLLFERFLNPERVSMPDFDIDFCIEQREIVIDYVTRKYGALSVAGISTMGTLGAKSAINSAGRALDRNPLSTQEISKLIPAPPGVDMTLDKALEESSELAERYRNEPSTRDLVDHAMTLEGLPKSVGRHPSGIVIARGLIADFAPVYVPEGTAKLATQFTYGDAEKVGLVKFDFLGLKNLTMIDKAVAVIRTLPGHENFDLAKIPLDDPKVYQLFQTGDTQAVFQFESAGMQRTLRDSSPERIEDLFALNALYRPGPMDLIPEFQLNKASPTNIKYEDPRLEPILRETYGIMVYQEQVMQVAQTLGGYTLGGADLLRRAMGKKKPEEMAKHREIFRDGAAKNGVSAEKADKVFSLMEKFAGYGFNKSHACAYSILAYQTAYLKTHFPSVFFAAVLTVDTKENSPSVPSLISEAKAKGVTMLPPDINKSDVEFSLDPADPQSVRFGLVGIKGLGLEVAKQIVNARKVHGDFADLEDFLSKCSKSLSAGVNHVNKATVTNLALAGCFDALHPHRKEVVEAFPLINKYNQDVAKRETKLAGRPASKTNNALGDLFALSGVDAEPAKPKKAKVAKEPKEIPEIERYEWPTLPKQSLIDKLQGEQKALGFYLSGHPMAHFQSQLGGLKATETIAELKDSLPSYDLHLVAGVLSEVKTFETKNGKAVRAKLSDNSGEANVVDIVAFADAYSPAKDWFKDNQFAMLTVQVKVNKRDGSSDYMVESARNLSQSQEFLAQSLHVSLPRESLGRLQELARANRGDMPVAVWHPENGTHVRNKAVNIRIGVTHELLDTLRQEFGQHVKLGFPQERVVVRPPPRRKFNN